MTVFPTSARARRPETQFQKSRQAELEARVWWGLPRGYTGAGGLASTQKGPESSFGACYSYQKDCVSTKPTAVSRPVHLRTRRGLPL